MKIDKPSKPLPARPAGQAATHAPAKGRSGPPPSAQPTSSTSVSLGSTSAQLNNIQSSIVGAPVVDANKVAQIKQAMSEGHFKVNSGVVADSLIETVRKLIRNGA